jgi:two-component system, LuxR family, response regulator FixJ
MKHVYVIDDNELIGTTLGETLGRLGYTTEVYNDPLVFLQNSMPVSPAVILLDMRMPTLSGVELQQRLNDIGRKTPIVFVSGESLTSEIVRAMKQGAVDFLFKPFNLNDLLAAIELGLDKDLKESARASEQRSLQVRYDSLTPREKQVCTLLVQGLLSKRVAADLGISNATIKVHKARILEKMQVTSLQQLALGVKQLELA